MRVAKREKKIKKKIKRIIIIIFSIIMLLVVINLIRNNIKRSNNNNNLEKFDNNKINNENEVLYIDEKNDEFDIENNQNLDNVENVLEESNSNIIENKVDVDINVDEEIEKIEEYKEVIVDNQKDENGKSIEWAKIEGSSLEQYRLYIKDKNGEHIRGNLEITTISGDTFNEFVTKEGSENVFIKPVIKSVKIKE